MNQTTPSIGQFNLSDFPNPKSMVMFTVPSVDHPGWRQWFTKRERLLINDTLVIVIWSEITTTVDGQTVYTVNPLFFGQRGEPTPVAAVPGGGG